MDIIAFKETFIDLSQQSDKQLEKLKKVMLNDIPALNKMILNGQVPLIGVKGDTPPPLVN